MKRKLVLFFSVDWFRYVDSNETEEKYCDVNEAIDKELKTVF